MHEFIRNHPFVKWMIFIFAILTAAITVGKVFLYLENFEHRTFELQSSFKSNTDNLKERFEQEVTALTTVIENFFGKEELHDEEWLALDKEQHRILYETLIGIRDLLEVISMSQAVQLAKIEVFLNDHNSSEYWKGRHDEQHDKLATTLEWLEEITNLEE